MFNNSYLFVQNTFVPKIGCISSTGVEQICEKNNLSFVDMLRPFSILNSEFRLRDPSASDHSIKTINIYIQDVNARPPLPSTAKLLLNEAVSNASCETKKSVVINNLNIDVPADCTWFNAWCKTFLSVQYPSDHEFTSHLLGCLLVISSMDPPETLQLLLESLKQMQEMPQSNLPKWFSTNIFKYYVVVHDVKDGDREKAIHFFNSIRNMYGNEQCFFLEINSQLQSSPTAVISDYWVDIVSTKTHEVSENEYGSTSRTPVELSLSKISNNSLNELDGIARLEGSMELAQEAGEYQQPVVLHPLSPDLESAPSSIISENEMRVNNVQKMVHLDAETGSPNLQYGNYLTSGDIENIRNLIKHLVSHLIQFIEKQIFHLNDLVANKKGVSRSLLSATKRLFSTTKTSSPNSTSTNSIIYAYDSPELQLRRLADLYFMFNNYSLAFQAYHSVKRDFAADQAYLHLAGALEMAALSAFMQGDMNRKSLEYMEEAISTYLNVCKLPQFATRATLFSAKFLQDRQRFAEAAKQLIRMTSEDSDLRSALLLEQASYCFLYCNRPYMGRKYAFHMVLAGHRFSKSGQRKHALRCYKQAFQVYENKGWNLAEDHIHFTIGRLAGHLKMLKEGSMSLSSLLSSGIKQTPVQQITYLNEYLQMLQQLSMEEPHEKLQSLPLPIIEHDEIRILLSLSPTQVSDSAFIPDSPEDFANWTRMEELALTESQGAPMIFRPTVYLFSKYTSNVVQPMVVINEAINVQITLKNPLQILLPLLRVQLFWTFSKHDGEVIHSTMDDAPTYVRTDILESIHLHPNSSQKITLLITPLCSGEVDILGMHFTLTSPSENTQTMDIPSVRGKQLFLVRGPKVKHVKEQKSEYMHGKDFKLHVKVVNALPLLEVVAENWKTDMLCGEIANIQLKLKNSGNAPLKNLYLVCNSPPTFVISNEFVTDEKLIQDTITPADGLKCEKEESLNGCYNAFKLIKIRLGNEDVLHSNESVVIPLLFKAPDRKGLAKIDFLFYYENLVDISSPRYRITRFSQNLCLHDSLQICATVTRSKLLEDKDTLTMALNATNLNESGRVTIYLKQIALATRAWELQQKVLLSNDLKLNRRESYSCVVRAKRCCNRTDVTSVRLEGDDEQGNENFYDFPNRHNFYDDKDSCVDNIFKMVLFVKWKAILDNDDQLKKIVTGQSQVTVTALGVSCTWPAEDTVIATGGKVETLKIFGPDRRLNYKKQFPNSLPLENALSYSLLYDHKIQHSFEEQKLCRVEMKLLLRNCIDFPLRIMINKTGTKCLRQNVARMQLYTPRSSSAFTWSGRCSSLLLLNGNQICTVSLIATFTAPGTYDLGSRLKVSAALLSDVDFTDQLCSVESSIIIV